MDYKLKSIGLSLSSEVKEYLDKKIGHVTKFMQGHTTHDLEVDLVHDSASPDQKYKVSLRLQDHKRSIYAQAYGATLHEAIDISVAEFGREVLKVKEKDRSTSRSQAARLKDFFKGFRKRF